MWPTMIQVVQIQASFRVHVELWLAVRVGPYDFLPLIVDVTMMVLLMLPYVYIAMDACCHCNGNAPGCVGKFQSTYCDNSYDCKMIDS